MLVIWSDPALSCEAWTLFGTSPDVRTAIGKAEYQVVIKEMFFSIGAKPENVFLSLFNELI